MPHPSAFQTDVARLQLHVSKLTRMTTARAEGWRKAYVQLRREIMDLIGAVARSAETVPLAERDAARDLVRRLRHEASLHQAEWPVVRIDLDDPAYVRSRRTVEEAVSDVVLAAQRIGKP